MLKHNPCSCCYALKHNLRSATPILGVTTMVSHALGRLGLGLLFLLGGCLAALAAGPGSKSPPPSAARESSPPPAAAAKDELAAKSALTEMKAACRECHATFR